MADELKRISKEAVVTSSGKCPRIFEEGLRKTAKTLGHDIQAPGRDCNTPDVSVPPAEEL
jgi:hypothetical protein